MEFLKNNQIKLVVKHCLFQLNKYTINSVLLLILFDYFFLNAVFGMFFQQISSQKRVFWQGFGEKLKKKNGRQPGLYHSSSIFFVFQVIYKMVLICAHQDLRQIKNYFHTKIKMQKKALTKCNNGNKFKIYKSIFSKMVLFLSHLAKYLTVAEALMLMLLVYIYIILRNHLKIYFKQTH